MENKSDQNLEEEVEFKRNTVLEAASLVWEPTDLLFLQTNFDEIPLPDDNIVIHDEKARAFLNIALIKGKITKDQQNYFHKKFTLLLEAYNAKRANVQKMCNQIRTFYTTLKEHRFIEKSFNSLPVTAPKCQDEMMKASKKILDKDQFGAVNIADERLKLLKFQNKLLTYDTNYNKLSDMIKYLREEKSWLQNESNKTILQSRLKKRIDEMWKENVQLEPEISSLKVTHDSLKEKLKTVDEDIRNEEEEYAKKQSMVESLEHELQEKQSQRVLQKYTLEKMVEQFNSTLEKGKEHYSEVETLESALQNINGEIGRQTAAYAAAGRMKQHEEGRLKMYQHAQDKMGQDFVSAKQLFASQRQVAPRLFTLLREANYKKCKMINQIQIASKDIERVAKDITLINNRCNEAKANILEMQNQYDILNQLLHRFKNENHELKNEYQQLFEDVKSIKKNVLSKGALTAIEAKTLEKSEKAMYKKQEELSTYQKDLQDIQAETEYYANERQKKASACLCLVTQLQQLRAELKVLGIRKETAAKQLKTDLHRLEIFRHMCDTERNKRNRDYQLTLAAQQKLAEFQEHLKVLTAEANNLRTLKHQRESQHRRVVGELHISEAERDTLSNELITLSHQTKEHKLELETVQELEVRARHILALCQREGNQLCKNYNAVVDKHNRRGLQVRDHLEEATIFTEKLETFSAMLEHADRQLRQRDEVSAHLKVVHHAESHHVELLHRRIGGKHYQLDCLAVLCTELEVVTRQEISFEHHFNTGLRQRITRQEQGRDEDPSKLQNKFAVLERRVLLKEAQLIELRLVYEQVQRITMKLQQDSKPQLHEGHHTTRMKLAIHDTTEATCKQTKSLISELALVKTLAQSLKQELEARREELELAKRRLENGEAPTVAAERQWERRYRNQARSCFSPSPLASPSPRPTAYIPNQQVYKVLPLPRPYGALAPFKPSPPAHKLRFYLSGQKGK